MKKNTKVYISTPITGHDIKEVRLRVDSAKKILEKHGYIPVSPLEVSSDLDAPYSEHMGKDIAALLECDEIYLLKGWQKSLGCRLEYEAALIYGKYAMFE